MLTRKNIAILTSIIVIAVSGTAFGRSKIPVRIGGGGMGIAARVGDRGIGARRGIVTRRIVAPRHQVVKSYNHRRPLYVRPAWTVGLAVVPSRTVIVSQPEPIKLYNQPTTVWVTNSNGSQIPVELTREGPWYVGPQGEYYAQIPTNEQLRTVYGF